MVKTTKTFTIDIDVFERFRAKAGDNDKRMSNLIEEWMKKYAEDTNDG